MKKYISVAILVCLFSFISCNNEEIREVQEQSQTYTEGEIITFDNGLTVQYKDGKYFWQGDIILSQQQVEEMSSSTRLVGLQDSRYRWSDRTVPFKFHNNVSTSIRATIRTAFEEFNTRTCVTVREATNAERDYVLITSEGDEPYACYGRQGGEQLLNYNHNIMGSSLSTGTICEYMLYTMGMLKEINSPDRDDYITILWENIPEEERYKFEKYPQHCATSFGVRFDYNSVTMPSPFEYSKNGKVTFVPKDPNATIGQRVGMSEGDILSLNRMYGCE